MNALDCPVTVAVVGRGGCETAVHSIGFLRAKLDSQSVIEASAVVNVADNKCRKLQF